MRNRTASIVTGLGSTDPELVLVLEIIGDVADFYRAVRRIPGLEFLAGIDEQSIDAAEDFLDPDMSDQDISGTLFLLASNQAALSLVLSLWRRYKDRPGEPWPYGFTNWRDVFDMLNDVRVWGPEDRVRGTGVVEDFDGRAQAGVGTVRAEVELWFRSNGSRRVQTEVEVRAAVESSGGRIITNAEIPEIAYHALLIDLPIGQVRALLEQGPEAISILRAEGVAFLRPEAQALVPLDRPEEPVSEEHAPSGATYGPLKSTIEPLVGVIDGMPLAGHQLLAGRVDIDDPEQFDSTIEAADRVHGTAIAGAVLHGDLNAPSQGPSRVYVRPALVPERSWKGYETERLPPDALPVDLFHRAIRRMVDPDDPSGGVAPSVRIINVSIGDAHMQLTTVLSPWARLLDWLAYKYRLLFCISSGNHLAQIRIPTNWVTFSNWAPPRQRGEMLKALIARAPYSRLLSPAEAVNALTIGSTHDDESGTDMRGFLFDLLAKSGLGPDAAAGIYGARGTGYKRSIKPDVLAPGGRLLYQRAIGAGGPDETIFDPSARPSSLPPGIRLAAPGPMGQLGRETFWYGTSISTAIVTHHAGALAERLLASPYSVPPSYIAPLVKAMTVHACSLGAGAVELRDAWPNAVPHRLKEEVGRFFGYGVLEPSRLIGGTEERITLFDYDAIRADEGLEYVVPLPPSLSGKVVPRSVVITVAALLPSRNQDRRYREVEIYFLPDLDKLRLTRADSDRYSVRRGSVQHEVLSGRSAAAFVDGDVFRVTVSCRPILQPRFGGLVPFGIVVTMEAEGVPVYAEVEQRVAAIRTRSRARQRT